MAQYGDPLITSTIIPFLADRVFGNVENDKLLQKAISFDQTLTELDKSTIIDFYSRNTNSVISTDPKFKQIFWKQLFTWLDTQKTIANGDSLMLAKRILPINPDGGYYPEAYRNFDKFGFQATKAYEALLIEEKINEKFGKDSDEARNEKIKLKNGDLVLLKKKDGTYDYFENHDIRRALESVKRAADLYNRALTQEEGNNTYMISFNPLRPIREGETEVRSTILDVNKQVWANKNYKVQVELEQKGLYVDGTPTVGENGVLSGVVIDSKSKKTLKVEVNLASPADKKTYKFTFTNPADKGKNFSLKEDELDYFKEYSPNEILNIKQTEKNLRIALPPSMVEIRKRQAAARSEEGRVAGEVEVKPKASEPIKAQLDQTAPEEPPVRYVLNSKFDKERSIDGIPEDSTSLESVEGPAGPILAKEGFNTRLGTKRTQLGKEKPRIMGGDNAYKRPRAEVNDNRKNPLKQIVKWHIIGLSAGGGILGFLTSTNILPT